jgi:hypothetical protein
MKEIEDGMDNSALNLYYLENLHDTAAYVIDEMILISTSKH